MKLIIGLGNPGKQYEHTRHNVGFLAIDFFLHEKAAIACQSKFKAQICEYHEDGEKVFFVKPQTFMNLSGHAVKAIADFYKLDETKDILVLHDEIDLPFSKIKVTGESSGAGHNGVQNIIDEFGHKKFQRIRIGVESRESRNDIPTDVFVLQPFTHPEKERLTSEVFPKTSQLIDTFIKDR
ncbi:MAG: aminoacyl-tRNA hydrolase [bacterium]|nr:aminoacyl-tRNA hydrolase [bacterium]